MTGMITGAVARAGIEKISGHGTTTTRAEGTTAVEAGNVITGAAQAADGITEPAVAARTTGIIITGTLRKDIDINR